MIALTASSAASDMPLARARDIRSHDGPGEAQASTHGASGPCLGLDHAEHTAGCGPTQLGTVSIDPYAAAPYAPTSHRLLVPYALNAGHLEFLGRIAGNDSMKFWRELYRNRIHE